MTNDGVSAFDSIVDFIAERQNLCEAHEMKSHFKVAMLVSLTASASPVAAQAPARPIAPREVNITTDSAQGWLPSEQLERDVKKAFDRYYAAVDGGNFRDAYEMLTDGHKAMLTFKQFEQQSKRFHTQAGSLLRREVLKITWTKNPANAPYAGVYAAIDEAATFRGVDRQCGYVFIYQARTDGDLKVMRVENNFIDNASATEISRTQSASELNRMWAALSGNCPNFALAR